MRDTVEGARGFSIFWMTREGIIPTNRSITSGGIKWSRYGVQVADIRYVVTILEDTGSMRLVYKVKGSHEPVEAYRDMDYSFPLVSIKCHFGGVRWFFLCWRCGRRVAFLYSSGDYFLCRHCADLSYESCNEGKRFRAGEFRILSKMWRAEERLATLKRRSYAGKPTKKYRKYLQNIRDSFRGENAGVEEKLIRMGV